MVPSLPALTSVVTETPDPIADWQTYHNEEYGFEFKYPGGLTEKNPNYIRIQNSSSDEEIMSLAEDQYYLEIFIPSDLPCTDDFLMDIYNKDLSGRTVVFGDGPYGGDAGGTRKTLCADSHNGEIKFSMSVTVNPDSVSLADQILSTFGFIE